MGETLPAALRELTARVTQLQFPFYRKLYGLKGETPLALDTLAQWRELPFLTRDLLAETPLRERLFGDLSESEFLRASSGTSGKPPVFTARRYALSDHLQWHLEQHTFDNACLSSAVTAPPYLQEELLRALGKEPRVVVFDPREPELSVRLARDAGVDALSSVFRFHIPLIAREMERLGMREQIRLVEFSGEACNRAFFGMLRSNFPNATLFSTYGMGEADYGPAGVGCRPITGEEPLEIFHVSDHMYAELLGPGSEILPLRSGTEGELVLTTIPGNDIPCPLLRFRTGDLVRVVEERCQKHGRWSFTVLGRADADFLKFSGGLLRADEIERVLRLFPAQMTDEFRLEYKEEGPPYFKSRVALYVEALPSANLSELPELIMERLRVGPERTYADAVREGLCEPLLCLPLHEQEEGRKRRRMVTL